MSALLEALAQLEILKKLQKLDSFSSANLQAYKQSLVEARGKCLMQLQLYQEVKRYCAEGMHS